MLISACPQDSGGPNQRKNIFFNFSFCETTTYTAVLSS